VANAQQNDNNETVQVSSQQNVKQDDLQKGYDEYEKLDKLAEEKATEISEKIVKDILETDDKEKYNMTIAMLSISKTMVHLASYFYEKQEDFLDDIKKARGSIPADIIPALLKPTPCGECEKCRDGFPDECIAPIVRADMTTSRIIPMISSMLVEYDLFNKILWANTVGKEELEKEKKEESAPDQK
jgi:hypothetical protein